MLDDITAVRDLDASNMLGRLASLPHSYEGPDGLRPEPYGLIAYGEASSLPQVFKTWVDAPVVVSGTQFIFSGGFDYGEAAPMKLNAELGGAEVVVLGHGVHQPNLLLAPDSLSTYTYAGYLAHATGHKQDWFEANQMMEELAVHLNLEVETAQNPAKVLAWALWNRVPLLLASRRQSGLVTLVQRMMGRVGKTVAIAVPEHPLEFLTGAFESRHQLADDMVAVILGEQDEELQLAKEVLSTRVAQLESLALPFAGIGSLPKDTGAYNLVLWYISIWVASYLALLNKFDPSDSRVYQAVRSSLQELEP